MKLTKHVLIKKDGCDDDFFESEEMISGDVIALKSKAYELCRLMGVEPSAWVSRYPIMGSRRVDSNTEWVMTLDNGVSFLIEE